jgi:hypothetical protein
LQNPAVLEELHLEPATLTQFVRDELLPPVVDSFIGGVRAHDFEKQREYAVRLAASIIAADEAA